MYYRGYWRVYEDGKWVKYKSEEDYLARIGESPDTDSEEGSTPPPEDEIA